MYTLLFVFLGLLCRRHRRKHLYCKACGCKRICRPKRCTRRVCKKVKCTKLVCRIVKRYRIVKRKVPAPYYPGGYVWKTKRIPYTVRVCKSVPSICIRCRTQTYICGQVCRIQCKPAKVSKNAPNSPTSKACCHKIGYRISYVIEIFRNSRGSFKFNNCLRSTL